MADTIQVVLWALGKQCPLRHGPDWEKPGTTIKTLSHCRTYSKLRKREGCFGVFGDVCVTTVTGTSPGKGPCYNYPSSGFVLSSQFASLGGLSSLHRLCGECPANLDAGGIAGCVGSFRLWFPDSIYSEKLQEYLEGVINRLGIAAKLDSVFPQTHLQWFRFWIHSPIPAEGTALLLQLFQAIREEDAQKPGASANPDSLQRVALRLFTQALDGSLKSNIPLHVNLTPPGHTDFGWYTIFPHCPHCKAEARLPRWKRRYADKEISCEICGIAFSPAKTHSAQRDNLDKGDLRDCLGQSEFEKLAADCLVAQGASETEAADLVQTHEEQERERRAKLARAVEASRRHQQFVENVIYQGLTRLTLDDKVESGWLFSQADMEEILRRCKSYGGKVFSILHVSESGEHDEAVQVPLFASPEEALQKLLEKGCNEKFSPTFKIPETVVKGWHEPERK